MAYQLMWFETKLPDEVVNMMSDYLKKYDSEFQIGKIGSESESGRIDFEKRKNKNVFIPSDNWISGFCYHYVMLANKNNFLYDIEGFGNDVLQYSSYEEGEYYNWHVDTSIALSSQMTGDTKEDFLNLNCEKVRKLSITIQLSDACDYSGGEFQLLTDEGISYFAPKEKGTVVIFDSRLRHRVRKVRKGCRRSLVGWAVGPRWR